MKKLLIACALVALAGVPFVLVWRVTAAERAWAKSFGPLDQWPARLRMPDNGSNAMLAERFKELMTGTPDVRSTFSEYVTAQRKSSQGRPVPDLFIATYRAADIDEFAHWLLKNDPPVVPRYVDDLIAQPPLVTEMQMGHLLTGAAMARFAAGDVKSSRELLEAMWHMTSNLRSSPVLFHQLIAMACFRDILTALRKTDVDAEEWLPRIRAVEPVKSVAAAMESEAWRLDASVRRNVYADPEYIQQWRQVQLDLGERPTYRARWLQILRTPIRWFDLPTILEGRREALTSLPTVARSEMMSRELLSASQRGAGRWWYIPDVDVTRDSTYSAFSRALATTAERELTEKVLLARARRKNGGRWPDAIDTSSSIAGGSWVYQKSADGVTIRFGRAMEWSDLAGANAPLTCTLH
jgi:hypothetical protein